MRRRLISVAEPEQGADAAILLRAGLLARRWHIALVPLVKEMVDMDGVALAILLLDLCLLWIAGENDVDLVGTIVGKAIADIWIVAQVPDKRIRCILSNSDSNLMLAVVALCVQLRNFGHDSVNGRCGLYIDEHLIIGVSCMDIVDLNRIGDC